MILRRIEGSGLFRRATFNFMVGFGMLAMPISTYAANVINTSDASTNNAVAVIAKTSSKPTAEPGRPMPVKIEPRVPTSVEMARAMELMEERVRQLESQLLNISEEVASRIAKGATKAECANALASQPVKAAEFQKEAPVVLPELAANAPRVKLSFKSFVRSAKTMFSATPMTTLNLPAPPKPAQAQLMPVQQQQAPAATAPAPAPAPKKDEPTGALNFFKDVEVSGIVDGYYSYNSNKVDLFSQGRAFDVRHNAFSLQMAKISFERKNSKENPIGFRVELGVGETVDRVISVSDSSRNDGTKHVLQAYASYVAPIGKGLTLDFGKFYTPIGGEVVDTKDNFNYSRAFTYWYGGPFYHMGLRAKYAINDKVAVTGLLVNGWDNVFENNAKGSGKSVGGQISVSPTSKFTVVQSYLVGKEAPLANVPATSSRDNVRHIADTLATVYVNDKLTLMGEYTLGKDGDNDGKRGQWQAFASYLRYALNSRMAFSPRFEVFKDREGLRTGLGQTLKDLTLTHEIKLVDNFITRFEYRRDFSDRNFFTNSGGAARNSQNTFIIGLSYFFTTKGQ
ncbi:MAG: outer membrane beta-barrel protein [Acidobacteria bacterium]|nr:outer membrane beta-barrel protein [Acidobacteriota bacterium]